MSLSPLVISRSSASASCLREADEDRLRIECRASAWLPEEVLRRGCRDDAPNRIVVSSLDCAPLHAPAGIGVVLASRKANCAVRLTIIVSWCI